MRVETLKLCEIASNRERLVMERDTSCHLPERQFLQFIYVGNGVVIYEGIPKDTNDVHAGLIVKDDGTACECKKKWANATPSKITQQIQNLIERCRTTQNTNYRSILNVRTNRDHSQGYIYVVSGRHPEADGWYFEVDVNESIQNNKEPSISKTKIHPFSM